MPTRHDRRRRVEDESRDALPEGHQGFVRGRDVHDAKSQAAAPQRTTRQFDRRGEKRYAADLQRFERRHAAASATGGAAHAADQLDEELRESTRE